MDDFVQAVPPGGAPTTPVPAADEIEAADRELAEEMRDAFLASDGTSAAATSDASDAPRWLEDEERPFAPLRTERERQALRRAAPVWRACVRRTAAPGASFSLVRGRL